MKNLLRAMYMAINAVLYKLCKNRSAFYSFINLAAYLFWLTRGCLLLICSDTILSQNNSLNYEALEIPANILIVGIIVWLIYDLYIKKNYLKLLRDKRYNNDRTYIKGIVFMAGSFLFWVGAVALLAISRQHH